MLRYISFKKRMSINDDVILQEGMSQKDHKTRFREMCREQSLLVL